MLKRLTATRGRPTREVGTLERRRSHLATGQSVVEFALVLPIVVFLMIAIVDLGRIYTTMLSVESAAREAADFGAFGSFKWAPGVYDLPTDGTEARMELRACTASSDLPDYVGPDESCGNPTFSYEISGDKGATWATPYNPAMTCDDASRNPPCWVKVTMHYDFQLLVPIHIELLGLQLGIPDTLSFDRTSIYAMTDLQP
jgi:hypothetical protein